MRSFDFNPRVDVRFGLQRLNDLATIALPGKKALIITTNGGSVRRYGTLDRVINLLQQNHVESVVYSDISPNPLASEDMAAAAIGKENGCDFVIGLGGGSAIDAAKLVALMCTNPGTLSDYMKDGKSIVNKPLPVVSITTTSGTGSEVDPNAVASFAETNEKIGYGDDSLIPVIAIVDPELMVTAPANFTAYQGMDTFFHLSENYISSKANVMSEMFILKGLELVNKYLPRAVADGTDLEARYYMAYACTIAGYVLGFGGTGSQHPMEHSLSAFHHNIPHGAGLVMLSDSYFGFFADKDDCPRRYAEMAKAMGMDIDSMPEEDRPGAFLTALTNLKKACGVNDLKMSDYGVTLDEMPKFAEDARRTGTGSFEENDRYRMSLEETISIYEKAFK